MENNAKKFALKITIALVLGIIAGIILHLVADNIIKNIIVDNILSILGEIFVVLLKMTVVPIVFISIVNGIAALGDFKKLGSIGICSMALYFLTTAIAITLAIAVSNYLAIGSNIGIDLSSSFTPVDTPSVYEIILNFFPENITKAFANGDMIQVIVAALFFGSAIVIGGEQTKDIASFFNSLNQVIINIVIIVMKFAPIGVFCLLSSMIASSGFNLIIAMFGYFFTVILVLLLHLFVTYGIFLYFSSNFTIFNFLPKIFEAMLFAFSISSSSASIPIVMQTARDKLKLSKSVSSFIIPLGATINMDGTAIMQGVATVFIANVYHVDIGVSGYITVIMMATLSSIGTAGVPGVGLITLAMVLTQVGLPVEAISLIIGVDRILDMSRTAINIAGDLTVAAVVDKILLNSKPLVKQNLNST